MTNHSRITFTIIVRNNDVKIRINLHHNIFCTYDVVLTWPASPLRVSFESWQAPTPGLVVGGPALGVGATIGLATGVLAVAGLAHLVVATLKVVLALGPHSDWKLQRFLVIISIFTERSRQLTLFAVSVCAHDGAGGALAADAPLAVVGVSHRADLVAPARVLSLAEVLAGVADAGVLHGAVLVHVAVGLGDGGLLSAMDAAVASQRRHAATGLPVVGGAALGTDGAGAGGAERDAALAGVVALLALVAVVVVLTTDLDAAFDGVALQSRWTVAAGTVIINFTLCPVATDGVQARINTVIRDAGLAQWTVRISDTLI